MSLGPRLQLPPAFRWSRVCYVVFTTLMVQAIAGYFIIRIYGRPSQLESAERFEFIVVLLLTNSIVALIWLWFQLVWRESNGWAGVGMRPISQRRLVISLLAGLAAFIANMVVTSMTVPLFGKPKSMAMLVGAEVATPMLIFGIVLAAVVIAPLMEELLFRGLIYGRLRRHFRPLLAALIAAIAHSAIHLDKASVIGLILVFIFFGWLYERLQTLWAPVLAHATHNAMVLLMIASQM